MVEADPEHVVVVDACFEQRHCEAECAQQRRECSVQVVAEPTPSTSHDLVDETLDVERDRHAEMDVEVLERDTTEMRGLKSPESLSVGERSVVQAQTRKVGSHPVGRERHSDARASRRKPLG